MSWDRSDAESPLPSSLLVSALSITPVATLEGHSDRVWHVSWNPVYPNLLASCGGDCRALLWSCGVASSGVLDKTTWQQVASLEGQHERTVRHVSWSPNGAYLACASFDSTVSIWLREEEEGQGESEDGVVVGGSVGDWVVEGVLDGHESEIKSVEWLTDTVLVTASRDRNLWVWERVAEGEYECAGILSGHQQDIKYGVWAPIFNCGAAGLDVAPHVVSCSYDGSIRVWRDADVHRQEDWHCVQSLRAHEGKTVWCAAFQTYADTISETENLPKNTKRRASEGESHQKNEEEAHSNTDSTALSPCRPPCSFPLLCTSGDDASLVFYRYDKQQEKYQVVSRASGFAERSLFSVQWAPHGIPIVATASGDNSINFVGLHEDAEGIHTNILLRHTDAHLADVNSVAFSPYHGSSSEGPEDGQGLLLASGGDDHIVRLWEVRPA